MYVRDRFFHRAGAAKPRRHLSIIPLLLVLIAGISNAQETQPTAEPTETDAPASVDAGELERARAEIAQLGAENQEVKAQLDKAKQEAAASRASRDKLQQQLTEVQQRSQAAEAATAEAQQRLEAAELEGQRLKTDLQGQLEQAQAKAAGLEAEGQKLTDELRRMAGGGKDGFGIPLQLRIIQQRAEQFAISGDGGKLVVEVVRHTAGKFAN